MLSMLRHRGPEQAGVWRDGPVALGHARLSIIDIEGGLQPMANEDGTVWAVVNGEVFNFVELRAELLASGHRFRSRSDSEVVVHLYEDLGPGMLEKLNGQFAFAVWDARARRLFLARDRLGVRPLFYTLAQGTFLFSSEIKALVSDQRVARQPDLAALGHVFTYWSPLPGETMLEGVHELGAGHFLTIGPEDRAPVERRYWSLDFSKASRGDPRDTLEYASELRALLVDATRIRLRSDVPVGAYLSGGLDSSALTSLAVRLSNSGVQTFSVVFDDADFDERSSQEAVAKALGTDHHMIECSHRDIAGALPETIWHSETPLLRTAPVPMFILSSLVRDAGLKVVLTGEGADELFAGYDIFKEALVRRFWARRPESQVRPLLFRRLYEWIPDLQRNHPAALAAFFARELTDTDDPLYSHLIRWQNTSRLRRLFSRELSPELSHAEEHRPVRALLPPEIDSWDALSRAQYLEVSTFMTPYLLSSQGDRMAMAHSVEGRFPFLDHRVVEFASSTPPNLRMVGLRDKHLLREAVKGLLPDDVVRRPKHPYRAPIVDVLSGPDASPQLNELLAPEAIARSGFFDQTAVERLRSRFVPGAPVSESDAMGVVGVLTTQLWFEQFIAPARVQPSSVRSDIQAVTVGPSQAAHRRVHARRE